MVFSNCLSKRISQSRVTGRWRFCASLACAALAFGIGDVGWSANPVAEASSSLTVRDGMPEPVRLPSLVNDISAASQTDLAGIQQPVSESIPTPPVESINAPLSLPELEQLALQNNPTLGAAWANVNAARGRQIQGGLYPNPAFGYFADDIGENGTAGKQGGFVGQQFVTGGKLRLNRAIGGQEVQEFQFRRDAQQLRVLSDVRLRFYDSLVAQRRVELSNELVKIAGQSQDISQRLLQAQQVSQSDLLQAQIESQESQILINNAQNIKTEAWRRLAAVIGGPPIEERPLVGELHRGVPNYEWEETYARLLAESPQLSAAQARVQRARINTERARREIIPNIDTFVTVSHLSQTEDTLVGIQAGVPVPIFNRNQGNILQADSDLIAAENDARRIELELQDRLGVAYRRYANARQQVDRYQNEILPRAKQSIELVTRGYGAGQVDFLSLLTSQRTYIRVSLMYLDSLAELRQVSTLIDGQLLSDSLQTENPPTQPMK